MTASQPPSWLPLKSTPLTRRPSVLRGKTDQRGHGATATAGHVGTLSANPSPERDLQNQGKDLTTRGTLQPQGKTSEVLWVLRNTMPANIKSQLVYLLVSVQPLKTLSPVMAHHPEVWAPGPARLETGTNAVSWLQLCQHSEPTLQLAPSCPLQGAQRGLTRATQGNTP